MLFAIKDKMFFKQFIVKDIILTIGLPVSFDLKVNKVMPKLYEYFGLIIMFYCNEHEPIHVHGKCQGRESRAEIILINGLIHEICYTSVAGRVPLEVNEMRFFQELVSCKADEIITKWIDFFVLHKSITPERINRRLK
jgi:Domain of unknown function (DUF4160)